MTHRYFPLPQIGVVGSREGPAGNWRVELAVRADGGQDRFDLLHDEQSVGSFARVHRGQLRQGGFVLPLAVKLQREQALTGEEAASVRAKFDSERLAYLRVLRAGEGGDAPAVVGLHDLGTEPGSDHAASFPPCIVCRHAYHAIEPRCPACRGPLGPPDSSTARVLNCPACQAEYGPRHQAEIIRASVRRGPACEGCIQADEVCTASALMAAFLPARVLLFDLLDLDLEDFLVGRDQEEARARRPAFWAAWGRMHAQQAGVPLQGHAELAEVLDLFGQLVAAVAQLHSLGIVHYDIKPRNVCLAMRQGGLQARLIDLGFADAPREQAFLQQVQGVRVLETEYAAPELRRPLSDQFQAALEQGEDGLWCRLPSVLDLHNLLDPPAAVGDDLDLYLPGQAYPEATARVVGLRQEAPSTLLLRLDEVPALPSRELNVRVLKQTGPAADVFSLGVVLLVLMTREYRQVGTIRDRLLDDWLAALSDAPPADQSSRGVVLHLRGDRSPRAGSFRPLEAKLDRFGPALRPLAESLLGLALRMVVRGGPASWPALLWGRGDRSTVLPRVQEELGWVAARLHGARLRAELELDRQLLRKAAEELKPRKAPPRQPSGPEPAYDFARLDAALRAPPGTALARREAGQLLLAYAGRPGVLAEHLRRFTEQDTPRPPSNHDIKGRALPNVSELKVLLRVMRFTVPFPDQPDLHDRLAKLVQQPGEGLPEAWKKTADQLSEWYLRYRDAVAALAWTGRMYADHFLGPAEARLREHPGEATFRVGRNVRPLVAEDRAEASLSALREVLGWGEKAHRGLVSRWEESLSDWRGLPQGYRNALLPYEQAALSELERARDSHARWKDSFAAALEAAVRHLWLARHGVLVPWDEAGQPTWLERLFGLSRTVTFRIDPDQDDLPPAAELRAALAALEAGQLGPSARTIARILIEEHRELTGGR